MEQINLRQKQEYIADDGRHIEAFETIKKIDRSLPKDEDEPNGVIANNVYYGVMIVETPMGHQQMRFPIPDATTIDEALQMYHGVREKYIEEIENQLEARKDRTESGIIIPGKNALAEKEMIDNLIQR